MKQLLQYVRTGQSVVADVPAPRAGAGQVLVRVATSLVSAGTERMVVDFAEKNLIQKARSRPDLVRQVIGKAQREGVLTTLDAVRNRLEQPMALGYSCAGTVIEVGAGVEGVEIGERVACAGGGYAVHAEVVSVPKNLVVKVPDAQGLSVRELLEAVAFTTLGAITLQGIRLADVKLGETVAVIGLGLLGQLMVQMLKASGCVVVGMDVQPMRTELAQKLGADAVTTDPETLVPLVRRVSAGHGVDAVLITADTKSDQPVELAGAIARSKGVVVAIGSVGMNIPRKVYYEKELNFHISRSYGPGRYDPNYEEQGNDYPYAYVRWTEQRNMQAFVELVARGSVHVQPLITHRFPIEEAHKAYELIMGKTGEPFLGVVLTYPEQANLARRIDIPSTEVAAKPAPALSSPDRVVEVRLGVIGAGNFANATLLPAIKDLPNVSLIGVASSGGVHARSTADRFRFQYCTTEAQQILSDSNVNTVAILTRHHLHASQVIAGLQAGKHVFVEKPLCLTDMELDDVVRCYESMKDRQALMVGFNRRFAPFIVELKEHLARVDEPLMLTCRVNAGYIPPDHWTQDPVQGGGRLRGEGCHFIDLLIHLSKAAPIAVSAQELPDVNRYRQDNLLITIDFADGSIGTIVYVSNGDKGFSKESLEVFGGGLAARMDDYRSLHILQGSKRVERASRLRQDKGHRALWQAFVGHLVQAKPAPITFNEIVTSTRATLQAHASLAA